VLDINGGTEDPLTEVIVEKTVKLAKAGGHDPTRMCINVLAALESPRVDFCVPAILLRIGPHLQPQPMPRVRLLYLPDISDSVLTAQS